MESGIQVVMEVGLDKFTMEAVAKKANISKGGVLHHFPKKDILLEAMFKNCLGDFKESVVLEQKNKNVSSPIAYLFAALSAEPRKEYMQILKLLFQGALQSVRYQDLMRDWYHENVIDNIEQSSPKEVAAVLIADGLLLSHLSGAFVLSMTKKNQILSFINNSSNDGSY